MPSMVGLVSQMTIWTKTIFVNCKICKSVATAKCPYASWDFQIQDISSNVGYWLDLISVGGPPLPQTNLGYTIVQKTK